METTADQDYTFEKMEPRHARAVGFLHAKFIENSVLSDLGVKILEPLYASLLESGYGCGYVLVADGKVYGFKFARYADSISITQAVLRGWRRMTLPLIAFVLKHPLMAPKILGRLNETGHVPCGPGIGEFMSMAIEEEYRGGKNSVIMTELLFTDLKREGCHTVRWECMASNIRTQKFYPSIRGKKIGESEVSGDKVFWYERDLTS